MAKKKKVNLETLQLPVLVPKGYLTHKKARPKYWDKELLYGIGPNGGFYLIDKNKVPKWILEYLEENLPHVERKNVGK